MSGFKTHDEYIKEFTARRERIIKRTGRKNFTNEEYSKEIDKQKIIDNE